MLHALVVFLLIPSVASVGAGLLTHMLAKRQRWGFAWGILVVFVVGGLICYRQFNVFEGHDGVGWLVAMQVMAIPAVAGAVIGLGTGARIGRRT